MRKNKRVLVTGAAGFIGSHLVRELMKFPSIEIVALDDLSGGFTENLPAGIKFVEGSITDDKLLADLFEEHRFNYVYHLAAYAAEGLSHFIRKFNYTNNLIGSSLLINESVKHKVECFVFTSSIAVYGAGQVPMTESMVPQPEDPYGIAKYAVEMDLKAAHEMFGLNYVIFRPHNVYGEFQNIGDRYRNVVGIFMNMILQDRPLPVFGDGEQMRAFSHVGDIVGPIARSAWEEAAYGKVFNVGADTPCTVNELATTISAAMGVPGHPVVYHPPRNEVKIAYSDHSAVNAVFGEMVETPLAVGIEKMAAWVREHGARKSRSFGEIEILEKLPPSWQE
jgi:UDP-glucose 4-epimerase